MTLKKISRELAAQANRLHFGKPVTHVYNPLDYARAPHELYLERFGRGPKEVLFVGMNPGPFGMAQTGVPFGDVTMVRDFLGISAAVDSPAPVHTKRPIQGFACSRAEVSGSRLWGWIRDRFETPEMFFQRFFVHNYCPLVFLEESGRNRTPDKLPAAEREPLIEICDSALGRILDELQVKHVIGVGAFAEKQAERALQGRGVRISTLLHPSPASPKANRGWATFADADLAAAGIRF